MLFLRLGCGRLGLLRLGELRLERVDLALDLFQPVALGQAHGRGLGRLGADDQPVPAPQVAVLRHQARADRQLGLQAIAVGRFDDADGRQAQGQRRRCLNVGRQRRDAEDRQVDMRRARYEVLAPEGEACLAVALRQAEIEVVAQGGRQGQFKPLVRLDLVEHRPGVFTGAWFGASGQDLRQAARLGGETAEPIFDLAHALARLGLGIDEADTVAFDDVQRLARRLGFDLTLVGIGLELVEGGIVERAQDFAVAVGIGQLRAQTIEARLGFLETRGFQTLAFGLGGLLGGHDFDIAVGLDAGGFGGVERGLQLRFARWRFPDFRLDTRHGRLQPLDLNRAVGRQIAFTLEIGTQAIKFALEPFDLGAGLLFLEIEPFLFDAQSMHHGGGDRFFLTQRGDGFVGVDGLGLSRGGSPRRFFDTQRLRLHVGRGGFKGRARFLPLGVDDRLLQGADFGRDFLVLFRLTRLALQP